jgi:hypothetical protein
MKKILKNFFTLKPQRDYSLTTKRVKLSALAIILTQTLDYLTTWYGLTYTSATEANPLMESAVTTSLTHFALIKLIGTITLVYFTWRRPYAPLIASGLYALVVVNNLIVIVLA